MQNLKPRHFREVAAIYFNKPELIKVSLGICWHLAQHCDIVDAYVVMQKLMFELDYGYHFRTEEGYAEQGSIEEWESRAYMCLFLAEYLEDKQCKL